jgi:hypothetical protein
MSGYNPSVGASGKSGNQIPKGYRSGQIQNYTPEQMQLFQRMFGQVAPESYLSRLAGGDESLFEQMEAPSMRQFQGLQGQLASRFSMGGGGPGALSARSGSGFQNAANQQTMDFAERLAANRQNLQMQAIRDMQGLSHQLLNENPYENVLIQKKPSFWKQLLLQTNDQGRELAGMATKAAMAGAL